jgi:SecD/SecF fusion protein
MSKRITEAALQMIKKIIEAPFQLVGWLFKDTYGRVAAVMLLTLLVCLVNYPIQDTVVDEWIVKDTITEEYSKEGPEADTDASGRIDKAGVEKREFVERTKLHSRAALVTMPFHHVSERQLELVTPASKMEDGKRYVKHRRIERTVRGLTLGLDLRGGTELEYRIVMPEGDDKEGALRARQVADIILRRIDAFGLKEPRVQPIGEDRILVQIPGFDASDVARIRNIITRTGRLEFRVVANKQTNAKLYEDAEDLGHAPDGFHWYTLKERMSKGEKIKAERVLIKDEIELTGEGIERVSIGRDDKGEHVVNLKFTDRDSFWRVTRENKKERLAICLDDIRNSKGQLVKIGSIHSAPVIQDAILGPAQISGGFTQATAEELRIVISSGSLRTPLEEEKMQYVGPYQGMQSIEQGQLAIVVGFIVVVAFIIIYYLQAGTVAAFALLLNLLVLVAALALRGATLTLPGIAGIMLTVGMSIDANVLIFERIREELKKMADKPLVKSMRDGHGKALTTIIDANLTTLITAIILHEFGTGPIRGFATTLSYGIIISMFTAVVVTRVLFEAMMKCGMLTRLPMLELVRNPKVPFIKLGKTSLTVSSIVVIACLVAVFVMPGERLGVEFRSGMKVEVNLEKSVTADVVRERLDDAGFSDFEVQEVFEPLQGVETNSAAYSIRLSRLPEIEMVTSGKIQGGNRPDLIGGAQVTVRVDRNVDVAELSDLLAARGMQGCEVEKGEAVERDGTTFHTYVIRSADKARGAVDDLRSAVRSVMGSQLVTVDIRRAFGNEDGTSLLVSEGMQLKSKIGEPVNATVALVKGVTPEVMQKVVSSAVPLAVAKPLDAPDEQGLVRRYAVTGPVDSLDKIKPSMQSANMSTLEPFASIEMIAPSVARELGTEAAVALGLALLAIIAYIWFRFEFRFGLAAVAALVHDVGIALGVLALTGREIDLKVIAALLTIIGYSLNDTIVVFDRIRENRRSVRKTTFPDIVNMSINQTLSRTILTSFTTFIAVLFLFLMGGPAINTFALTLLVGVVVGTYSSIFIASPILLMTGEQGAMRGPLSSVGGKTVRPLEGFRAT